MSPIEQKVLEFLCSDQDMDEEEFYYNDEPRCYFFHHIAHETGLEERVVRRCCRSLKRKELSIYVRGLFDEDTGLIAGSGYCVSELGAKTIWELIKAKKSASMAQTLPL